MRYVVDASVALKWVIPEPDTARARQLRSDFQQQIHKLLSPDVFPLECANALVRAERRGILLPSQGIQSLADILSTPPQLFPYLPLLPRAFQIASHARCGIYDCVYVALAEQEQCQLVTADSRLLQYLQTQFSFIVLLSSLP